MEKDFYIKIIVFSFFIILGIYMIFIGVGLYKEKNIRQEDVPCYDKNNNEIKGLICNKKINSQENGIGAILFGTAFIVISISYILKMIIDRDK